MPKFDIPAKPNLTKQLILTGLVLIVVGIIFALLAKLIVSFILFLLGATAGIGGMVIKDNPLGKE